MLVLNHLKTQSRKENQDCAVSDFIKDAEKVTKIDSSFEFVSLGTFINAENGNH